MSSLTNFRTAIASTLDADSRLDGASISTHGGDFDKKELARYAKQAPACIVSLHHGMVRMEGGQPIVDVSATIVCLAKDRPALPKDVGVMQLVEACLNILGRFPNQYWGLSNVQGPKDIRATNAFSEGIDTQGIAMWIIGWTQAVTLIPATLVEDTFNSVHIDWDLQPMDNGADLGDVIDAQDDIDLT